MIIVPEQNLYSSFIIIFLGGTYNDIQGIQDVGSCKPCPAGKYCPQGSETDGYDCPMGFYCTDGQASGYLNACPKGTYGNATGYSGKKISVFYKDYFYNLKFCGSFISKSYITGNLYQLSWYM